MGAISRTNIVLSGSHAGVSIGEDGPSQMALEDIASLRAVFGSTVLDPSDANQAAALTRSSTLEVKLLWSNSPSLDLCGFFFYEVMGAISPFGFAHSAHLGGMLAGWIRRPVVSEYRYAARPRAATVRHCRN